LFVYQYGHHDLLAHALFLAHDYAPRDHHGHVLRERQLTSLL
jgi:hypothetical protein